MEKKNDFINKNFVDEEIEIETDLIKENINRMCVTHNRQELQKMYSFAMKRIDNLFNYNLKRIDAQ